MRGQKYFLVFAALLLFFTFFTCAEPQTVEEGCRSNDECDDSIDCTVDTCGVGGNCTHQALDELCAEGETCNEESGCQGPPCTGDEQCDDLIECTFDFCEANGECSNRPLNERCDAGQVCEAGVGCQAGGCTSQEQCDDEIDCTIDNCNVDGQCEHYPENSLCPEGEHCVETLGCQTGDCDGPEDCDDGNFCNGQERCLPEFGCEVAEAPRDCDDGEDCTIDSCDTETDQCIYTLNPDLPECNTFDPTKHLAGCFAIDPRVHQWCAFGMVSYNISEVCFELVGPVLTMTAGRFSLSQSPAPSDANFSVQHEITGGCVETYTLTGTFTDANSFSGTWTSVFTGAGCAGSFCNNRTFVISGTRTSGP